MHGAGFNLQIQITRNRVIYGCSVCCKILRTAKGNSVRPYHNTSALTISFLSFYANSSLWCCITADCQIISGNIKLQARSIACEAIITKYSVRVSDSSRVVASIPFQLITSCGCRTACKKAGEHGMPLYTAFNTVIVIENLIS